LASNIVAALHNDKEECRARRGRGAHRAVFPGRWNERLQPLFHTE